MTQFLESRPTLLVCLVLLPGGHTTPELTF